MYKLVVNALAASALFTGTSIQAQAGDETAIKNVIKNYEKVLNSSDVNGVLAVYTEDGVFMPAGNPTAEGLEQIKTAYEHVFQALDLNVVFNFDEIVQKGDLALVRTLSKGSVKMLDKNVTINDAVHREMFVLRKTGDQWKIARYMFNQPAAH